MSEGLDIGLKAAEITSSQIDAAVAYKRNKKMMDIQLAHQEELNKQGQELAMQTWKDTNYPAQVEMLKAAGLNPALLYSKGGSGGTTNSGSGGSAASIPVAQASPTKYMDILQIQSAVDLNKALADKARAETPQIAPNAEVGRTKTSAEAENVKADTVLKQVDTKFRQIQTNFAEQSFDENLKQIVQNNQQAANQIRISGAQVKESEATVNDKIKQIQQNTIKQGLEMALLKEGILKTQAETDRYRAEIEQWSQEISQNWEKINQKDREIEIQKSLTKFNTSLPAKIGQWTGIIGNILKGSASISQSTVNVDK
nr:MAG: DNA pilot protein [Microviridae sp.]